ncbi:MAG: hypothetical protein CBB70_09660 [Planctomycetaceae bacterium TMED10]|nr:MAG: hypothetical protein CBB70_09660 [Planctomycetaceae bacterium TMED10]
MVSFWKYLLAVTRMFRIRMFVFCGFLLVGTADPPGFAQGPPTPQPVLNWEFENTTAEEVSRGDVWTLQDRTAGSPISYGGWFSGGLTVNNWGNTSMLGNSQLPFNNDPHLNVNQGWLWAEKEADTENDGVYWGFHVDLIAGCDGPDTEAFGGPGWDSTWQWGSGQYGAAVPQAYVQLAIDRFSIIIGRFFTILGYEQVPSPYNFFYSHDYTMAYGEPFTHTGLLCEYPLTETITLLGGWTNGWDQGFQFAANGSSTFLGGIQYQTPDERTSVMWTVTTGYWGKGSTIHSGGVGGGPTTMSDGNIYDQSFVWQQMLGRNWTYVFQTDLGLNQGTAQAQGNTNTQWYSVVNYLFYNFNYHWATGIRCEWFSDPQGVRVDRADLNQLNAQGQSIPGLNRANYWAITLGLNYRTNNNFRLRPEIRYDWANGMGTNPGRRFDPLGNAYRGVDLWTLGMDAIWLF